MPRKSVRTRVPPPASSNASDASRFQLLVQGVTDYALYMLSAEGVVTSWNAGAERMKGYTPDEIIGRHFSQFFTGEDRDAGLPQRALAEARQIGRFESEGWRVRKDGTRFWVSAVLDAIHDEAGALSALPRSPGTSPSATPRSEPWPKASDIFACWSRA